MELEDHGALALGDSQRGRQFAGESGFVADALEQNMVAAVRTARAPTGTSMALDPFTDILLVTATAAETTAVIDVFGVNDKPRSIDGRVYFDLGRVNGALVKLTQCEMGAGGLGGSLQAVSKGIAALSPTGVVMVGIAFGASEERQSIGDILVAERLRPYDLQRIGTGLNGAATIILRDDKPHVSPWLLNLCRSSEVTWNGAPLRFGVVLTGAKLVDNVDFRDQLRDFEPEAIGGEMEGAGLYVACHDQKIDWILVKAICDFANGQKSVDKDFRQKAAAQNAAAFIHHILQFANIDWTAMRRRVAVVVPPAAIDSGPLTGDPYASTASQELANAEFAVLSGRSVEWRFQKDNGDAFLTTDIAGIVQPFRHKLRYAIILLDINGLTQVNDKFGLQVGDTVLRRLTEHLMNSISSSGRCGDDTFFALLRGADLESALRVAIDLRDGISRLDWNSIVSGLYISCAFGVAELRDEEPLSDWVARAAIGMKRAKSFTGTVRSSAVLEGVQSAPEFLSPTEPRDLRSYYS